MKKRKRGRKFGRQRDQRKALKKTLAVSLIKQERVQTTLAKAKELRPFVEKLVTKAKKDNISTYRLLQKYLPREISNKLIKEIAPKFKERAGGYLRIIRLPDRQSDGAKLAIIEFVSPQNDKKESKSTT
jgi:large subunit ribosomal protein L17